MTYYCYNTLTKEQFTKVITYNAKGEEVNPFEDYLNKTEDNIIYSVSEVQLKELIKLKF